MLAEGVVWIILIFKAKTLNWPINPSSFENPTFKFENPKFRDNFYPDIENSNFGFLNPKFENNYQFYVWLQVCHFVDFMCVNVWLGSEINVSRWLVV